MLECAWQKYLAEAFVVEPFLDEAGGINPRPATLLKRSLHEQGFLVNLFEFCSTSKEKSDMSSIFDEIGAMYSKAETLLNPGPP